MKNLLALYGSPRRNGNSNTLLKSFVEGANSSGCYQIKEVVLRDLKMSPCLEIYNCKNDGICAIKDDFQDLVSYIDNADVVALSSPVMFYAVSAHTKIFMDRCQSFWARKYILNIKSKPKRGYFFCVGATKGTKLFDGILMNVKYFLDSIDAKLESSVLVRGADMEGDIFNQPEALDDAYKLGKSLD